MGINDSKSQQLISMDINLNQRQTNLRLEFSRNSSFQKALLILYTVQLKCVSGEQRRLAGPEITLPPSPTFQNYFTFFRFLLNVSLRTRAVIFIIYTPGLVSRFIFM